MVFLSQEIRELLALNFIRVCISLVSRSCNQVAHAIAASGYELGVGDSRMLHFLPTCIMNSVANDLACTE